MFEFNKISQWINSLPEDVKIFITDAVAVSDTEFSDQNIIVSRYYQYERCIRYLLTEAVLRGASAGKFLLNSASSSLIMDTNGRWPIGHWEQDKIYHGYIRFLRAKKFGDPDIPPIVKTKAGGWEIEGGIIDQPSRTACLNPYPSENFKLKSLDEPKQH